MTYNILAADKDALYEDGMNLKTVLMPGVPKMLTFLSQHNIAAAIITRGPLETHGIAQLRPINSPKPTK